MTKQKVPPKLGRWSDVSRVCSACIPDDNNEVDIHACYDCLLNVIEKIPETGACQICSQIAPQGRCDNQICDDRTRPFGKVFAIGYRYKYNLLHKLINHLKFNLKYYELNSVPLAVLLWGYLRDNLSEFDGYASIAPIPRTQQKAEEEGEPLGKIFDIARGFVGSTGLSDLYDKMIQSDEQIIQKVRETEWSYKTDFWDKVDFAYRVNKGYEECPFKFIGDPEVLKGKRVLLVDDIFTSGYHSMFHAALALCRVGIKEVDCLVLSRQMDTRQRNV